jgi:hypothetical protein
MSISDVIAVMSDEYLIAESVFERVLKDFGLKPRMQSRE